MTGLPDAIIAAQGALIHACKETGSWRVGCDGGPAATATVAVALRFMGQLDDRSARGRDFTARLAGYLQQSQQADGGFPASPAATRGDLSTTALCLAGLIATNAPQRAIEEARTFIGKHGGLEAVLKLGHGADLGAIALGMVGEIQPRRLSRPPLPFELAPGAAELVMEHRFAYILPFRALVTEVLVNHLVDQTSWRLPAPSFDNRSNGQTASDKVMHAIASVSARTTDTAVSFFHAGANLAERATRETGRLFGQVASGGVNAGQRIVKGFQGRPTGLLRAMVLGGLELASGVYKGTQSVLADVSRRVPWAIDTTMEMARSAQGLRCEWYLRRFENRDGSYLYGDSMHTALALAALHALEVPHTDPRMVRGLRWLRTQQVAVGQHLRFDIFSTDVWPTTFAIRALLASGVPATDPVITRAANWLISIQNRGSWAFQANNTTTPDSDDTAVALGALALVRDDLLRARDQGEPVSGYLLDRCETAIASARRWLNDFQNADGGWPSYQHGLPSKPPGPIMTEVPVPPEGTSALLEAVLRPMPELGDPATEDLTGRALHALGLAGARSGDPAVARAIAFLRHQQAENGGWWGRWVVNFVAGTAWVLRGLAAVGAERAGWIHRGMRFLLEHQNDDGGWGETAESYRDPSLAGKGPSNPCLTGLVVCALIEMGEKKSAAVQKGVAYLLRQFTASGWKAGDQDLLHTLFPPNLFYTLPLSDLHMPLEALGLHAGLEYRRDPRMRGLPEPGQAPDLDPLEKLGDPAADDLVEALHGSGQIQLVNQVLRRLTTTADLPAPGTVPPGVLEFLERTDSLPAWVDREKIELAQNMFVRCGWGVGSTLFCSALPQCYAFPQGARVLLSTGGFVANARRRVMETAQLVFDVATPRGLEPKGRGIRTTQKVRLLHAGIRLLLRRHGGWPAGGPVPLSQLQMLGTLMTFSAVVTDGLRALGFEVSAEEAEAWFHLWRAVGSILGIPEPILPPDLAAGQALFDQMRAQHWGASTEGRTLTQLTLEVAHELIPGEEFDDLAEALVRHLAGDHCADLLEVPRTDWNTLLSAAGVLERLQDLVIGDALIDSPLAVLLQKASFRLMQSLTEQQREGKGVDFEIPLNLRDSWLIEFRTRLRP
jgi:squalene cyclase